jgi:glycerol-3-phosphate acyltransferase PlsY
MLETVLVIFVLWAAYLAGSIPFGLLVTRAHGIDIRAVGSGNIGATNVARALGKPWAILVLALDAAKGYGPVILAQRVVGDPYVVAGAGLAAIVGHVLPVWLKFRGGKGVATGLGVFLALAPIPTGVAVGMYVLMYAIFRISSVGSLAAAPALLTAMILTHQPAPTLALGVAACALIVVTHRANIKRLIQRAEHKVHAAR